MRIIYFMIIIINSINVEIEYLWHEVKVLHKEKHSDLPEELAMKKDETPLNLSLFFSIIVDAVVILGVVHVSGFLACLRWMGNPEDPF